MAVFAGITNTGVFDPGFSFSAWANGIGNVESTLVDLSNTDPYTIGQNPDGSYYAYWANGTQLWGTGSYSGGVVTIKEFELSFSSGTSVGMTGTIAININTGAVSTASAKEVWMETADGYSIDYRGSLAFDLSTGTVSGSLKTLYLAADNGAAPGDANYVKLAGSVTMDSNGNFTGGQVTGIEWGTLTFSQNNGDPAFSITGKITGLKIDATTIESALEGGGFDGLIALAYGGNDTVTGTSGDDTLNAGAGNDKIDGGDGNDHLTGGNGNDTIVGGAGNDRIWGDTNDAALNITFTASNDKITDLLGNNFVFAGSGNNQVTVGDGNDWVQAGGGNDKIVVGGGDNLSTLFSMADDQSTINPASTAGGVGYTDDFFSDISFNNVALARLGNNSVTAGSGNDYIKTDDDYAAGYDDVNSVYTYTKATDSATTDGNNKIIAGDGYNVILAGDGNNNISAGNGTAGTPEWMNQIFAGNGNNKIVTGTGDDLVVMSNGNNNVTVGDGFNEVQLGTGNNKVLAGNGGNEVWIGNEAAFNTYFASGGATKGNGNSAITTGTGDDLVAAWEGNDSAKVGAGADQVDLGSGNNKIDLGADSAEDVVTFGWDFLAAALDHNSATLASNAVANFNVGDSLWFNLEDLGALTLEQIDVSANASITSGNHNLVFDTSTGKLYYDADGTGNGEAAIQIGLIKGTGLTGAYAEVGTSDVTIHSGGVI